MSAPVPVQPSYGVFRALRNVTIAAIAAVAAFCTPVFAEKLTIVALGDSLTQGYGLPVEDGFVPQLQAWLVAQGQDVVVENAGVSGDTTAGGLSRVEWSLTPETDALIVNLGGNDLLRGIDPTNSAANLDKILTVARDRNLPVLLVGLKALNNYGPDFKQQFDAIYPDLAAKFGLPLYPDYFGTLKAEPDAPMALATYMQADGIHPNADGVAKVIADLGPHVIALLESLK
jgi:acyl-CoA thioesterase I